jgi:hypothetical protein
MRVAVSQTFAGRRDQLWSREKGDEEAGPTGATGPRAAEWRLAQGN